MAAGAGMSGARRRGRGLRLEHVWVVAGLSFFALRALLTPIAPHDFWWHMATGRLIAETGQIPATDGFSYTQAGQPFYNQSWLAQLLMFGLFQIGGPPLLVLAQAALLAATYGLLLRLCLRRGADLRASVGFMLLATLPASFDNWLVRPQTYALALFVIYLYVLTMWRLGPADPPAPGRPPDAPGRSGAASLLVLPALAVVWVNLHGSFVLGGALIGITFAGEWLRRRLEDRRAEREWALRPNPRAEDVLERPGPPRRPPLRQLLVAGALTGLAWLANPGGIQVIGYVRDLLSSSAVTQLVTEWAPQTVRQPNGVIFFIFLIAGTAILAYARRPPDLVDMLLAGAFLWLALGAVRNNIWFTAVATPLLAGQLATLLPRGGRPAPGLPALNAAVVGVIGLMLLLALPWVKPALALPPELGAVIAPETPVAAVEALRADPDRPERLFHAMSYGSYLIWAAPEQPVWADPRIELYPLEQWQDYLRLSAGTDAEELLGRYQIDGLLLSGADQAGLLEYARARPAEWELRYEDEQASYLVRR